MKWSNVFEEMLLENEKTYDYRNTQYEQIITFFVVYLQVKIQTKLQRM